MSVAELMPMWSRITYLTGMCKPSKYNKITTSGVDSYTNVPPFLRLTIGEMYVSQAIIVDSIGLSIPDDSLWEMSSGKQYKFGPFTMDAETKKLPMKVEIDISCKLVDDALMTTSGNKWALLDDGGPTTSGDALLASAARDLDVSIAS